jgi:hypothetical protein
MATVNNTNGGVTYGQSTTTVDTINDRSINPLIRIADTLDEILKLVKDDMAASKKRWENENIGE